MNTKKFLFYLLAALLGGCVPVLSLNPLYTDKDVVFEKKLLGTWLDDKDPNNKTIWQFSDANKPEKAYKLIFTDNKGIKGAFVAYLAKLQDKLFLDVYPSEPPEEQEDPNKIRWPYNLFLALPCHTFIKIDSIEPNLMMRLTDDGKMKELFKQDPNAVEHISIEDKPVLTASTQKLQAFVLKYAGDSRVFTEECKLIRKAEPQKEKSVDTNKYGEVNPSELSFSIKDYNYRAAVSPEGGIPTGGHIGQFLCEGQNLELVSDKFEDGFVLTKNYGKIKIRFSPSLYSSGFSVWLTPEQKNALKALKKK